MNYYFEGLTDALEKFAQEDSVEDIGQNVLQKIMELIKEKPLSTASISVPALAGLGGLIHGLADPAYKDSRLISGLGEGLMSGALSIPGTELGLLSGFGVGRDQMGQEKPMVATMTGGGIGGAASGVTGAVIARKLLEELNA